MATATKTKKKTKKTSSDLAYATAVANEKYGPQISEIKGLYDQAKQQYASDIDAAKNNAASGVAFATQARPQTISDYASARSTTDQLNALQNAQLAKAPSSGGVSDVLRTAITAEQTGQGKKIANERANSLQALTDRATAAASGQQFAANQAKSAYQKTADTLTQKLVDIAGQQGNEIAVQLGKLQQTKAKTDASNAKTKAANQRSDSTIYTSGAFNGMTHGEVNALTPQQRQAKVDAYNKSSSKGKAKGQSRATSEQRQNLNTDVQGAINDWTRIAGATKVDPKTKKRVPVGLTPDQIRALMLKGQTPSKDNGMSSIKKRSALATQIAEEMATDNAISSQTVKKLHDLGYKTTDIDRIVTAYQRSLANRISRPGTAPAEGGNRPT